jgi:putative flippase GtrA
MRRLPNTADLAKYKPSIPLLKKVLVEPSNHSMVQLIRYGLVATVSFAVDFILLYLFTSKLHIFYMLSATLSFSLSVFVNYALSMSWAFGARVDRRRHVEIILFVLICATALILNDLFLWMFTSAFGVFYLYSKLITVAIVFFWSFGARRLVFHSERFKKLLKS